MTAPGHGSTKTATYHAGPRSGPRSTSATTAEPRKPWTRARTRPTTRSAPDATGAPAAARTAFWDSRARLAAVVIERGGRRRRAAEHGLTRRVLAPVPTIGAACPLALATDALALVPDTVAEVITSAMPPHTHPIPLRLPPVRTGMAWHRRLDTDPAHRWLRRTVSAARQHTDTRPGRHRA